MSAPAFRVLRPNDARILAMLHADAFDTPWSPAALRGELVKPSTFGLALEEGERMISFVLFQRALDEAEMLTLATAPDAQRRGNAQKLVKTAFQHLLERGVSRCLLDVAADNTPALTLYKSFGFKEDGRRKAYYKRADNAKVDAILMSSDLTGL